MLTVYFTADRLRTEYNACNRDRLSDTIDSLKELFARAEAENDPTQWLTTLAGENCTIRELADSLETEQSVTLTDMAQWVGECDYVSAMQDIAEAYEAAYKARKVSVDDFIDEGICILADVGKPQVHTILMFAPGKTPAYRTDANACDARSDRQSDHYYLVREISRITKYKAEVAKKKKK